MSIRNKLLIIIGLGWAAFFLLSSPLFIRHSYPYLTLLGTLTGLVVFGAIYFIFIKRIQHLYHSLFTLDEQHEIKLDEIDAIMLRTIDITKTLTTKQSQLNEEIEEKTHALQQKNTVLEEEIKQRDLIDKQLLSQRHDYLTQIGRQDDLTNLPNRVVFNEILNKALNHVKRRNKLLAVLIINLDALNQAHLNLNEKQKNSFIKEMSKRFSEALRSEDVLAKLEGNEFIVLLNDIAKSKFAGIVAEKLLQAAKTPVQIDDQSLVIQASIGISIYPNDGESLEKMLENTDLALYTAIHQGGGYQFFNQEMNIEAKEYLQLESALKQAIQNNEFTLYYQPKLHIKKGNIVGVEALIRWEHPQLGIIHPAVFLPLAEETNLIYPIGEWALREACRVNKVWQEKGYVHITIAINLSPRQFYHANFAETVAEVLADTGLSPHYLELEITEKTAMNDTNAALAVLNKLKETGVKLSLDHFGTGYTSISHLKQFPLSALKIDQTFIKGVPENPNDSAITAAIISLAHHLGFEIIAEGVETAEQVQFLASEHCDIVQGYFLSHPLPEEKIELQFKKLKDEVLL